MKSTSIDPQIAQKIEEFSKKLEKRRNFALKRAIFRSSFLTVLGSTLFVIACYLPQQINSYQQIVIQGNKFISDDTIRNLLDLAYPQSIWQIKTQQLTEKLETQPPISQVKVTRELFPPQLKIQLQEKEPVAIVTNSLHGYENGFIDQAGNWLPQSFYQASSSKTPLPNLKNIGFSASRSSDWQKLYPLIQECPVKILTIDWRDPTNLILYTEIGRVHLGSYASQLEEKFTVLANMQQLPTQIELNKVAYIDIIDPDIPEVKVKK